jgi:hypothetical protein
MGSPSLFCNRFSTKGRTLRTVRLFDEATLRSGGAGLARVFDFLPDPINLEPKRAREAR